MEDKKNQSKKKKKNLLFSWLDKKGYWGRKKEKRMALKSLEMKEKTIKQSDGSIRIIKKTIVKEER